MKGERGFEALADGVLLFLVLLVATGVILATGRPPASDPRSSGVRYADDTRLALFRTTTDGLFYRFGGEIVLIPNGTTVEDVLRLGVHLLARDHRGYDFTATDARILGIAAKLLRPGWDLAILGGPGANRDLLHLPAEQVVPANHYASTWDYPSLDGGPGTTRLAVAVWLSPPR